MGRRPEKGMGVEVAGNDGWDRGCEWKEEEGIKGMCSRGDVMIEANETEMKGGRVYVDSKRVI
jgi:hypothetical protein